MSVNKIYLLGKFIPILVLALVLTMMLGSCKKAPVEEQMIQKISEDSLKLTDDAIKNLKLEKVVRGEFPEKLSLMGRISVPEDRIAVVPARVAGRTDAVFVASGEVVEMNQPLASIFSADFAIAREEYIQAVRQAQGTPDNSEPRRLLELSKRKLNALGVSPVDFEKWSTSSSGTSDGAKGESLTVRAPRAGALLGKNAVVGNIVNTGDTLFMIGDLNKVWFAGDIYPEDLRKVHKNQEVVIDPGTGVRALHGKVSFISPVMDPTSRTIKIRVLMENPGSQLRGDMYVQGNVILSKRSALIAPKSALVQLRGSVFCFKRLPGNIFKKVAITTNGESTDNVAVTQGLDDGDDVVSQGGLLLDASLSSSGT